MSGCTREQFMGRIRSALGRGDDPVAPCPELEEALVRRPESDGDLADRFAARAVDVGMFVHRVGAGELHAAIIKVLKEHEARTVVIGMKDGRAMRESLESGSVEIVEWRDHPGFEIQYDVDASVTDVHAAFAETGTVVCCSDADHSRGLSLVPPLHVAVVRREDILPDVLDFWNRMPRDADLPSSIAFITGPSKTADIEGVLVTGVHGPREVHVMLVGAD